MAKASSPLLFRGLKIGTPLAAMATAPFNKLVFKLIGASDNSGFRGIDQAFVPVYP